MESEHKMIMKTEHKMIMKTDREQFEEAVFKEYFINGISFSDKEPFAKTEHNLKARELLERGKNGAYAREEITAMWRAWILRGQSDRRLKGLPLNNGEWGAFSILELPSDDCSYDQHEFRPTSRWASYLQMASLVYTFVNEETDTAYIFKSRYTTHSGKFVSIAKLKEIIETTKEVKRNDANII
jgi:hypothetical protein